MIERSSAKSQPERKTVHISVNARRRLAALALVAGASLGFFGHDPVENLIQDFHQAKEYNDFGIPTVDIKKKITAGQLDGSNTIHTTVGPSESNPTEVAIRLHADNPVALARMIGQELGGDRNMVSGQELIIPGDLLKTPPQK